MGGYPENRYPVYSVYPYNVFMYVCMYIQVFKLTNIQERGQGIHVWAQRPL